MIQSARDGLLRLHSRNVGMKTSLKAISIGVAIEAALVAAFAIGGFGPCGPASPVSIFVYFVHLPAFYLASAMGGFAPVVMLFGLFVYAAIWSAIANFFLERRLLRKL